MTVKRSDRREPKEVRN
jgi:P-type E1-E2 ATPase